MLCPDLVGCVLVQFDYVVGALVNDGLQSCDEQDHSEGRTCAGSRCWLGLRAVIDGPDVCDDAHMWALYLDPLRGAVCVVDDYDVVLDGDVEF